MRKYLLALFFLIPSISFATGITLSTPDGTSSGLDCYLYGGSVTYTVDSGGVGVTYVGLDFDNQAPYDGSHGFSPGVTSGGDWGSNAYGTDPTVTGLAWASLINDPLPHSNPDHVWQIRYYDGSWHNFPATFVVQDACGTISTSSEIIATSSVDQTQQNIFFGTIIFLFGFVIPLFFYR